MKERRSITSYQDLSNWYTNKYSEMQGTWVTPPEDCNQHLDDMKVPFNKKLLLLDIGCGGGHFLEQATKRVTCGGLEISKAALKYAKERLRGQGVVLIENIIEELSPPPQFDYVTSIGSLEHVLDIDAALDSIYRLLKPDGEFYFYLPNTKWVHEDQPNELLADEDWWVTKLSEHNLGVNSTKPWGLDNIAYRGVVSA